MTSYLARRLLVTTILIVSVSILTFSLLYAIPGGPLAVYLDNPRIAAGDIVLLKHQLGLDRPRWVQYVTWFSAFSIGNWGFSYSSGEPVAKLIGERVPATLMLMGSSFIAASVLAVVVGVYSALRRYSVFDNVATAVSFVGFSMPSFWFALMLQLLLAVHLRWLPVAGYGGRSHLDLVGGARHLILPASILVLSTAGRWTRFTRSGVLEVLTADYVRTAKAKGLSQGTVLFRHALPNGLIPTITVMALDLTSLFSGAVVIEAIFAWPGMGVLMVQSIANADYPTLLAILMLSSFAGIILNFLADVSLLMLDPRIRYV